MAIDVVALGLIPEDSQRFTGGPDDDGLRLGRLFVSHALAGLLPPGIVLPLVRCHGSGEGLSAAAEAERVEALEMVASREPWAEAARVTTAWAMSLPENEEEMTELLGMLPGCTEPEEAAMVAVLVGAAGGITITTDPIAGVTLAGLANEFRRGRAGDGPMPAMNIVQRAGFCDGDEGEAD